MKDMTGRPLEVEDFVKGYISSENLGQIKSVTKDGHVLVKYERNLTLVKRRPWSLYKVEVEDLL